MPPNAGGRARPSRRRPRSAPPRSSWGGPCSSGPPWPDGCGGRAAGRRPSPTAFPSSSCAPPRAPRCSSEPLTTAAPLPGSHCGTAAGSTRRAVNPTDQPEPSARARRGDEPYRGDLMSNSTRTTPRRAARSPSPRTTTQAPRRSGPAPRRRRWTWWTAVPIAAVVLVVVTLVAVAPRPGPGPSASPPVVGATTASGTPIGSGAAPAPASVRRAVAAVDQATLRAVGVPGGLVGPTKVTGDHAALVGADGKPEVLYVGAEYCPYCAAQRWALAVALSRFGTFTGLETTHSSTSRRLSRYPYLVVLRIDLHEPGPRLRPGGAHREPGSSDGRYPTLQRLTHGPAVGARHLRSGPLHVGARSDPLHRRRPTGTS